MNCKDCKNKVSSGERAHIRQGKQFFISLYCGYCEALKQYVHDKEKATYCISLTGKSHFEPKNDYNPFKGLKLNK